jgi:hypothetical protein
MGRWILGCTLCFRLINERIPAVVLWHSAQIVFPQVRQSRKRFGRLRFNIELRWDRVARQGGILELGISGDVRRCESRVAIWDWMAMWDLVFIDAIVIAEIETGVSGSRSEGSLMGEHAGAICRCSVRVFGKPRTRTATSRTNFRSRTVSVA